MSGHNDIVSIVAKFGDIHYKLFKREDGEWMYKDMTSMKTMTLRVKNNTRTWAARRVRRKGRFHKLWNKHKKDIHSRRL